MSLNLRLNVFKPETDRRLMSSKPERVSHSALYIEWTRRFRFSNVSWRERLVRRSNRAILRLGNRGRGGAML